AVQSARHRCLPTNVQDGFPQQRSWSDRIAESSPGNTQPSRFPGRSIPIPLRPPIVAAGVSSRMKIEALTVDFTDEQKRYLEGFTTGLQISRVGRGLGGGNAGKANTEPTGPDAAHIKAQDKVVASGKKLADQEKFKREEHPFDAYPRLKQQALDNAPPSPADNFRWRYYGLFYVAPAQDSYMCRLRIPNGILKHWQFAGMADLAERLCGPFCHVT